MCIGFLFRHQFLFKHHIVFWFLFRWQGTIVRMAFHWFHCKVYVWCSSPYLSLFGASHRNDAIHHHLKPFQIARFMGPTRGPPGSCRPQMGPKLAHWTLLSGIAKAKGRLDNYKLCVCHKRVSIDDTLALFCWLQGDLQPYTFTELLWIQEYEKLLIWYLSICKHIRDVSLNSSIFAMARVIL